ncbi:PhoB family transcriptional regulator [Clostridium botulinum]|uniref:Stage 0 sporulation protein A homolog n=1 Tax=Clostridium botulinum TaxID=1491 RepID=A0A9Q1UY12_CLOBO|nr:response regulator transcription factor [Clostridium botulinum]AEB77213.1 DNA-binding response regulator [Clostridium botulinum BKT015925]KEH96417.1 PhoB family transcriptional regulator [Clostridium botulinum C/D str. Sp77]KEH96437.1 DNA-binding response regulator [Clostridium botulinum D str. 16868]KLU74316.1 DNA-binding response regulator [Clostridium botulinum V891]KOA73305.1 PhoB family transcriptional regulator [Clostridium botulinum]
MNLKTQNKILIADDDDDIRQILEILFTGEGYSVITAKNGNEAIEKVDDTLDIVILDVDMPEKSGFIASMEIRKKSFVPILFLTAYSQESDKTIGYSAGADDYVTKPFSHSELLLKVKALLRRYQIYQPQTKIQSSKIVIQGLTVDIETQTVLCDGKHIPLTHTEYKILELLITNRKRIFSINHIYNSVWQDDIVADSAVMVHIKNLRKKIENDTRNPKYIKTAWGKGYYID